MQQKIGFNETTDTRKEEGNGNKKKLIKSLGVQRAYLLLNEGQLNLKIYIHFPLTALSLQATIHHCRFMPIYVFIAVI